MDNEPNAHMQVDPSTTTLSAIQAFKTDPSTKWVIESAPGFVAIKHKMGCPICDAFASCCMVAKSQVSRKLLLSMEDYNILKESVKSALMKAEECRAKMAELYDKLDSQRVTIQNLGDQVQSWEKQLQETKDNLAKLPTSEELILENKHLKKELDFIPASDGEDNDEDLADLPTLPEEIPQDIPSCPPTRLACPASKTTHNDSKVICEAGIPAIGGYRLPMKQKRIIADPPTSITGLLPKPLGKLRAERWD
ncbi:hypothetical protein M422DRAFT_259012 [Sphaerobolus stellatus SS14]|uniref:Uncharacterized protein n=1 Tax=Sphaerobolus stellatus (strain SS14) TaxID=990650 RepID=A0A0C9UU46_SPHS4|nr:hypothetical protein M422DRAFT_259012 [Sphaerobolus stellatus SS14]